MKNNSRICAYIDLNAMLHNVKNMHDKIKEGTKILAVIKTDGYGHGAVCIAKELESVEYVYGYAVATVEEGVELRDNGMLKPILVLGYVFPENYEVAIENELILTVFTKEAADSLSMVAHKSGKECKIHIAIDTGMGRIGYAVSEESADEIAYISKLSGLCIEGCFTHFAKADEYDKNPTYEQINLYNQMISMIESRGVNIPIKHCSNSAGIIEIAEANMDMVRAGISLYGLWPSEEVNKEMITLAPVMSLISHVAHVKTINKGQAVSYGGTYVADKERIIATIPVGYGDGYPRGLSNKGKVLIRGQYAPICGRVCMDQFMVDVTDIKEIKVGDRVTLVGADGEEKITVEELSELSGRFNYEFVCDINKRVPRIYKN